MSEVEPIKNVDDIKRIIDWLEKEKGFKYKAIFLLGINSGLRISDILGLNVKDVLNKDYLVVKEKKTNKIKKFPLKEEVQKVLKELCEDRKLNDPLFESNRYNRLERSVVYRMLNEATETLNINIVTGTHTMRKTFGYHHYQQFHDVALLQKIFNHSSPSITLRYIGIEQEEINKSYHGFSYTYDKPAERPINYNSVKIAKLDKLSNDIDDLTSVYSKKLEMVNRKLNTIMKNLSNIGKNDNTYANNVVLYLKNYLESEGTRHRAFVEEILACANEMG